MQPNLARLLLPLSLFGLLSLSACSRDCTLQVRDGWVRMPPAGMQHGGMSMMAGFGRIENQCGTPATIVSAASPAFGEVSIHETRIVDGISRMRPMPELQIAPDDAAVLEPGGLHLMLMQPSASLKAGSKVAIEFTLQDGRTLMGEFETRRP